MLYVQRLKNEKVPDHFLDRRAGHTHKKVVKVRTANNNGPITDDVLVLRCATFDPVTMNVRIEASDSHSLRLPGPAAASCSS